MKGRRRGWGRREGGAGDGGHSCIEAFACASWSLDRRSRVSGRAEARVLTVVCIWHFTRGKGRNGVAMCENV